MSDGIQVLMARTRLLAGLSKARALTDRQLLEQFAGGDESAFTVLVDRYGGLVMGVCRRILQHTQDAEDAFQATFMVLARRAGKIAWKDSVANWMHGVACRICFQIRREKARRQARDLAGHEPTASAADPTWSDLKPVLDEELDRLPDRYRIPLILCCLEGKSRDEAAAQLGWSVGSLKGRLERGREILRSRLARRGLALSAALAATLMTGAAAKGAVPITLGLETVRAGMAMLAGQTTGVVSIQVLTLTQGALHAMFITKLKIAAAVLLAVVTLGLGTGYVTHQALAGSSAVTTPGSQEYVAQREERKAPPSVNGVVQSVDAAKNTINILVGRDNPDGQTFEVAKDVKVNLREGRELKVVKLADVQPKTRVTLILDDAKKIVQAIEVQGARAAEPGERGGRNNDGTIFRGLVTEIDAAKKTISFQSGGRGDNPAVTKTFDLAKDVKVTIRTGRKTKEGKLDEVPLKTVIQVKLDDAKKVVQSIEVTVSTTAGGSVTAITNDSITLGTGRDPNAQEQTFSLAKDVKVTYRLPIPGGERRLTGEVKQGKLADVVVGSSVALQLDDERKVVQSIEFNLPTRRGTLQDVDAKKGTILLRPARGDDATLEVAKDARILIDGKAGTLDKVAVGAEVHLVLSPDRARVLVLQTPLPGGREE